MPYLEQQNCYPTAPAPVGNLAFTVGKLISHQLKNDYSAFLSRLRSEPDFLRECVLYFFIEESRFDNKISELRALVNMDDDLSLKNFLESMEKQRFLKKFHAVVEHNKFRFDNSFTNFCLKLKSYQSSENFEQLISKLSISQNLSDDPEFDRVFPPTPVSVPENIVREILLNIDSEEDRENLRQFFLSNHEYPGEEGLLEYIRAQIEEIQC